MSGRLATTAHSTQSASTAVAATPGTGRDEAAVPSSYWAIVLALVVFTLGGAELFFRTNLVWQLPLEYLLQHETDRYTMSAWLVHHPPASAGNEVIVLGSSPAAAILELSGRESQHVVRAALDRPNLELIPLVDTGGCYPEHLTLLESALQHGHHPEAVILFSWPSCLGPYDETEALLARRMPLFSPSLADVEGADRSMDVRIRANLVRVSALQRYRYTVNAWLRRRARDLLFGRAPWRAVQFEGTSRATAWRGPWELDKERYERLAALPGKWTSTGPGSRQLASLLEVAKHHGVPVLIIESPWSPPFFDVLGAEADTYHQAMQTIAARGSATYVDPNRSARLSPEMFSDLFHVSRAGARAYLPVIASELRQLAQTW